MNNTESKYSRTKSRSGATISAGANASDVQLAALLACATVFIGFTLYWWEQVQSVLELLEMAYG